MAKVFRKVTGFLRASQRRDYQQAVARIQAALDSGQLKNTDKAVAATSFIEVGVFGPLDGVDWAELHALARENKMPLVAVSDLMVVLRFAIERD